MNTTIRWGGPGTMTLVAETGSGHSFVMDGAPEGGGRDLGPRPMEALLSAAAACSAYDVILILVKSGQDLHRCTVSAEATRAETDPKVFTQIQLVYQLAGRGLKQSIADRAVALSAEKYCSATRMLGMTADITHRVEITEI